MYEYKAERQKLFTDEGQRDFLKVRDNVKRLLAIAGAVRMQEATNATAGDSWFRLACVDRLVELGELSELEPTASKAGQDRVFVARSG